MRTQQAALVPQKWRQSRSRSYAECISYLCIDSYIYRPLLVTGAAGLLGARSYTRTKHEVNRAGSRFDKNRKTEIVKAYLLKYLSDTGDSRLAFSYHEFFNAL